MTPDAEELVNRAYYRGSTVVNCVTHLHKDITNRPLDSCNLCRADVNNTLTQAFAINAWLNEWKEDATKILTS